MNDIQGFAANTIARYDDRKVQELLANPEIVKNRLKIQTAIQNAHAFVAIQSRYGSFDAFLWQFVAGYRVRDFQSFERQLKKRLTILEEAQSKDDLHLLPSNHFKALLGDRKGQFSIRPEELRVPLLLLRSSLALL